LALGFWGGKEDSLIRVMFLLEHQKLQLSIPAWPRAEFFSQAILFSSSKIGQVRLSPFLQCQLVFSAFFRK
jgi:hypothetical protein